MLNRRVKGREPFRPFAPAVALEHVEDWFDLERTPASSPFMLRVCKLREAMRARVPGVVHVDGTGRLQSVERGSRFHGLLTAFHARTGVPMVVNTSFNVMGEPIVETPEDALWCMLSTGIDFCMLEGHLVCTRTGFGSLLKLVPRVVARRCTVDLALEDDRLGSKPGPDLRALVATPWGQVEQAVTADYLALLHHMNGQRTGHDILARLDGKLDDRALLHALSVLRQLRIIALAAAP